MNNWDKISLFKFQQIDIINKKDIPDVDKTLFSVCQVFGFTEFELDSLADTKAGVKKVGRMVNKVNKIFTSPFEPKPFNRIGKYFINYEISKVTFGQYIELSFFLMEPVQNAHYTLASVSNKFLRKNKASEHRNKADYFLQKPITKIMGCLSLIVEKFIAFNKEYSSLFGLNKEVSGDVQSDPFNKNHGWVYSATQIAKHQRISLDEAFSLPVRAALHDLKYLKDLAEYEARQLKQNSNGR